MEMCIAAFNQKGVGGRPRTETRKYACKNSQHLSREEKEETITASRDDRVSSLERSRSLQLLRFQA